MDHSHHPKLPLHNVAIPIYITQQEPFVSADILDRSKDSLSVMPWGYCLQLDKDPCLFGRWPHKNSLNLSCDLVLIGIKR